MTGQVTDELLQCLKVKSTEATRIPAASLWGIDDVSMHRTQVLQKMCFLLEHRHTKPAGEGLLARVHAQMSFKVPGHAELFAAVLATVFSHWRIATGRRGTTASGMLLVTGRVGRQITGVVGVRYCV